MKQSDAQCAKYAQVSPVFVEIIRRSRTRDDKRPCPYKYNINDDEIVNKIDKIYRSNETVPLSNNGGVYKIHVFSQYKDEKFFISFYSLEAEVFVQRFATYK